MTIVGMDTLGEVSLTEEVTANDSQAQMLARVGHPTGTIRSESGASSSVAQMNQRRQNTAR